MTTGTGLRSVQDQEKVVIIAMDLGHLIPIRRVPNRQRMKPERRTQRLFGLLIPNRYVDPYQPVVRSSGAGSSAGSSVMSAAPVGAGRLGSGQATRAW